MLVFELSREHREAVGVVDLSPLNRRRVEEEEEAAEADRLLSLSHSMGGAEGGRMLT